MNKYRRPTNKRFRKEPDGRRGIVEQFQMKPDILIDVLGYTPSPPGSRWDWVHAEYQATNLTATGRFEWDGRCYIAGGRHYERMGDAALAALGVVQ